MEASPVPRRRHPAARARRIVAWGAAASTIVLTGYLAVDNAASATPATGTGAAATPTTSPSTSSQSTTSGWHRQRAAPSTSDPGQPVTHTRAS